jgi:hypothetical protein
MTTISWVLLILLVIAVLVVFAVVTFAMGLIAALIEGFGGPKLTSPSLFGRVKELFRFAKKE